MQPSQQKTDFIIVKAYNNCDFQNTNCALLKVDEQTRKWLQRCAETAEKVKGTEGLNALHFQRCIGDFMSIDEEMYPWFSDWLADGNSQWLYVELTENEYTAITAKNVNIRHDGDVVLTSVHGSIQFISTGKYDNSVELCTEEIKATDLLADQP